MQKIGRPRLNRETKEMKAVTILPSVWNRYKKLCYNNGISVSEALQRYMINELKK